MTSTYNLLKVYLFTKSGTPEYAWNDLTRGFDPVRLHTVHQLQRCIHPIGIARPPFNGIACTWSAQKCCKISRAKAAAMRGYPAAVGWI